MQTRVVVRLGAGVGGSDRVSIVWADNAIENQWLQVTVLVTANTGLAAGSEDVHYWGNQIGETGNAADTNVTAVDAGFVFSNLISTVPFAGLANAFDINRDNAVTAVDAGLVFGNLNSTTSLVLFTPPAPITAPLQLESGSGGSVEASTAGTSSTLVTAPTLEVSSSGLFLIPLSLNDAADFEEQIDEAEIDEAEIDVADFEVEIEETDFEEEIDETDFDETDFEEEIDDMFHAVDWLDWLNDGSL